jgi:alpha-methylacyl-CoA racemase
MGRQGEKPLPPLNLVGDFGGGGMMLAFAMVSAILHARATGEGQVVDCAMTEGSAVLMAMIHSLRAQGLWRDERGVNLLDTGAPFYETYETLDGRYVAIGAIEPQFYRLLLDRIGLGEDPRFARQDRPDGWPELKTVLADLFRTRTRAEWCALLEGSDACFAPVLSLDEAPDHPHNIARGAFVDVAGDRQPAPAPRYARTPSAPPHPMDSGAAARTAILRAAGLEDREIDDLVQAGVVA